MKTTLYNLQTAKTAGPSLAQAKLEHPIWELRPPEEAALAWQERLRSQPPPPGEPFLTEAEGQTHSENAD
jgi:hypothetical protein